MANETQIDIFAEAENEIQEIKNNKFLKNIAIVFSLIAIIAISAASFYSYFSYKKQSANEELSNKFFALLRLEQNEASDKDILSFASSNDSSYSAMTYILGANKFLAKGKDKEFQEAMTKVAQGNYHSFFKDQAILALINFDLNQGNIKSTREKLEKLDFTNSLIKRFFILCRASINIEEKKYKDAELDLKSLIDDSAASPEVKEVARNLLHLVDSKK